MINIESLIKEAMISRNEVELRAYRNLKAEIEKYKTAKGRRPEDYTEAVELGIISKTVKSLNDAIPQFEAGGEKGKKMAESYRAEKEVLEKLLPAPVTEGDLFEPLVEYALENKWATEEGAPGKGYELTWLIPKKAMGQCIKHLKSKFPTADGKMVSDFVKKYIVG